MNSDEMVIRLRVLLDQLTAGRGEPSVLFAQVADLVSSLRASAPDDDGRAWNLIASYHWQRFEALPDGADGADFVAAVFAFTHLIPTAADMIPPGVRHAFRMALASADIAVSDHGNRVSGIDASPADELERDDPVFLFNSALALLRDPQTADSVAAMAQAIAWLDRAAAAIPADDPSRAIALTVLRVALAQRFELTGDVRDLDRAVSVAEQAVAATFADDPNLADRLRALGTALHTSYELTGEIAVLDHEISINERLLSATPNGHADRGRHMVTLGISLASRFVRTKVVSDLDRAIAVYGASIGDHSINHPSYGAALTLLTNALGMRFEHAGMVEDADRAIQFGEEVLLADSTGAGRVTASVVLGSMLQSRYERTGQLSDLDRAIALLEQVIVEIGGDSSRLPAANVRIVLGRALRHRYWRTGLLADLDRAISNYEAALSDARDDRTRAAVLSGLGGAVGARFERNGSPADLDRSIALLDQAVAIPTDDDERVTFMSNLSGGLIVRYGRNRRPADLDRAQELAEQAVSTVRATHPDRGRFLYNLGTALGERFKRSKALADLERSADVLRQAVAVTPVDHPDRAGYLRNLGAAYDLLFRARGTHDDITVAVRTYREGLYLETAVPSVRIDVGRRAAMLAGLVGDWESANADFAEIIGLLPAMVGHDLTLQDRQHLLEQTQGLGAEAARAVLAVSTLRSDERAVAAWQRLEAARNVLLAQSLETRAELTFLKYARPDLAAEFDDIRRILNSPVAVQQ
ncbi:tetratricopeptide (TPR) repeat protein [Allocatelliglobosispora scoriae]|uniref:Tetratricopeptide (TPR) repeat protein n=1 Tax=Allocatelliglobosispora scoriae TaxID=643052 RepID=A0A841BW31_9ACTN|nr:tetratricopeptide repeat protein [Allocatelliglobosispora scoriae]MBB5871885.1 tetratricopeptide (TPR) repeat protein [Allocatelliglobosispora scoriae]